MNSRAVTCRYKQVYVRRRAGIFSFDWSYLFPCNRIPSIQFCFTFSETIGSNRVIMWDHSRVVNFRLPLKAINIVGTVRFLSCLLFPVSIGFRTSVNESQVIPSLDVMFHLLCCLCATIWSQIGHFFLIEQCESYSTSKIDRPTWGMRGRSEAFRHDGILKVVFWALPCTSGVFSMGASRLLSSVRCLSSVPRKPYPPDCSGVSDKSFSVEQFAFIYLMVFFCYFDIFALAVTWGHSETLEIGISTARLLWV
jgi:hypothetical protein